MATPVRADDLAFTKLVVDDLDAMADYYCAVFRLHRATRARFEQGVGGEPIEELALVATAGDRFGALHLLKFEKRPAAAPEEVILGFTTRDLAGLIERIRRAGGSLASEVKEMPDHGIRVVFARDPEGHWNEIVEVRT